MPEQEQQRETRWTIQLCGDCGHPIRNVPDVECLHMNRFAGPTIEVVPAESVQALVEAAEEAVEWVQWERNSENRFARLKLETALAPFLPEQSGERDG